MILSSASDVDQNFYVFTLYNYNTAHHQAVLRGVLHRDISINNVMMYTPEGSVERKGLLIDFDHACLAANVSDANQNLVQPISTAIESTVCSFFVFI